MILDRQSDTTVHIRWMIRRDLPEVLEIEATSGSPSPWSENDFVLTLRCRNAIGMVAEECDRVVGFMVYDLRRDRIRLVNLAVAFHRVRAGIGTQMIRKLIAKLSSHGRSYIVADVRETNLAGQLFFQAMGFHAESVLCQFYSDTKEDAYKMVYDYDLSP